MKKEKRLQNKRQILSILCIVAVVIIVISFFIAKKMSQREIQREDSFLNSVASYQGYVRVVSQEEYEFYRYFVERNQGQAISEEELDKKVKSYINEANAVFYLGNKFGLYEPYSFDLLKMRMEQENRNRKMQLEQGEVVYGLEQFTLESFYQYERSNLEIDIIEYIAVNAQEEVLDLARAYYAENKELFTDRESVTYETTIDGVCEVITADRKQLNLLGNADMGLADFLEGKEKGDVYTDIQDGKERKVVITDISYMEAGFEENQDTIVLYYIQNEWLEDIIKTVAENNPVEFGSME